MNAQPGRPRQLTHKKQQQLLNHIAQGASAKEAAQMVGVSLRTVQRKAKSNDAFDHELQLALHAAPADPHQLMLRAARTHWRAAAWLLERTDPDRFARRRPNSCSPQNLSDIVGSVIEAALEATPPEHREAVYRHTRSAADRAIDAVMPDQQDSRHGLGGSLARRPKPLSEYEQLKTLLDPLFPSVVHNPIAHDDAAHGKLLPTETPVEMPGAPRAAADTAGPDRDSGILSPKTSAATEIDATEFRGPAAPPARQRDSSPGDQHSFDSLLERFRARHPRAPTARAA